MLLEIGPSIEQIISQYTMMTSSNGNIFHVTGRLCGEFTGALICAWMNDWVNNLEAGDLRRYRAHYDVTLMQWMQRPWTLAINNFLPLFTTDTYCFAVLPVYIASATKFSMPWQHIHCCVKYENIRRYAMTFCRHNDDAVCVRNSVLLWI